MDDVRPANQIPFNILERTFVILTDLQDVPFFLNIKDV